MQACAGARDAPPPGDRRRVSHTGLVPQRKGLSASSGFVCAGRAAGGWQGAHGRAVRIDDRREAPDRPAATQSTRSWSRWRPRRSAARVDSPRTREARSARRRPPAHQHVHPQVQLWEARHGSWHARTRNGGTGVLPPAARRGQRPCRLEGPNAAAGRRSTSTRSAGGRFLYTMPVCSQMFL